jgi:hypothetical protein
VYLTNRAQFGLLPPSALEKTLDMPQQIAGTYRNQEFLMETWVLADTRGVHIALFSSFGASLGELSFTESEIRFDSGVFPAEVKSEYIVADFQLCFYQPELLTQALKTCGLTLAVRREGRTEVRTIYEKRKIIAEIEKKPEMIRYTNRFREYEYILRGDF